MKNVVKKYLVLLKELDIKRAKGSLLREEENDLIDQLDITLSQCDIEDWDEIEERYNNEKT